MNIKLWGPNFWYLLHTVSYTSPFDGEEIDQTKNNYFEFYEWVANILPCDTCKKHYIEKLRAYPIRYHYNNKDGLINWVILLHNLVNKETQKKQFTREEVDKIYNHDKKYIKHRNFIYLLDYLVYMIKNFNHLEYKEFFKYFIKTNPIYYLRDRLNINVEIKSTQEFMKWYTYTFRPSYLQNFDNFIADKAPQFKLGSVPVQFKV